MGGGEWQYNLDSTTHHFYLVITISLFILPSVNISDAYEGTGMHRKWVTFCCEGTQEATWTHKH